MWGVAAQVYSLRRAGDGGIGDAGAVRDLAEAAARHGADAVALSPVHSLFPHDPARYGPYSPSSRLFLNPLYADPSATFDATAVVSDDALERAALIDWPAAGAAKFARLRALFDEFDEVDTPLLREFERFVVEGGEALAPACPVRGRAGGRLRALSPVPAMDHGALLRRRAAGGQGGRHAHRPAERPRDRHGPRRQPCLGAPLRPADGPVDRRAARCLQSARPGLGPDRLLAARPGGHRLRAFPRHPARRPRPCRRRAHRPHHGPDAPVADPARPAGGRGRLSRLSAGRPAATCWRSNRIATARW